MTGRRLHSLIVSACTACALVGLLGLATAAPVSAQGPAAEPEARSGERRERGPGGTWEWWNDREVQREIGLSAEKAASIDEIYRRRSQEVRVVVMQWIRESQTLDTMTRQATVDEATYNLQVLQVEALLSKIRESRTMMLYRFYRQLTSDQYEKLQDIFSRNRSGRGRSGPSPE